MSDLLFHLPEWHLQAACRGIKNPDIFFPHGNGSTAEALAICAECPVKDLCRQDAIDHNRIGIWGGTTRPERRAVREHREHRPPVQTGEKVGMAAINAAKTHCKWGHEFTPENTRIYSGKRACRTCYKARLRARRQARTGKRVAA